MQATPNQSLQDICIMMTGTIEALFEVAAANNMGVTDELVPGMDYIHPTASVTDLPTLQYLQQNGITIGTLGSERGIGSWKIGIDFTIS